MALCLIIMVKSTFQLGCEQQKTTHSVIKCAMFNFGGSREPPFGFPITAKHPACVSFDCTAMIVPEEDWFGQPKYSTL